MSYSEPLINQPRVLLLSVGVGAVLGVIYISVQSLMSVFGDGKRVQYCADIIFCVAAAVISFFFMVLYNNGRVRLHLLLGETAGFFAFYCSLGRYIYALLNKAASFTGRILCLFFRPYVIIGSSFVNGMKDVFLKTVEFSSKVKNKSNNDEKKNKKNKFFSKIHLKNSD